MEFFFNYIIKFGKFKIHSNHPEKFNKHSFIKFAMFIHYANICVFSESDICEKWFEKGNFHIIKY